MGMTMSTIAAIHPVTPTADEAVKVMEVVITATAVAGTTALRTILLVAEDNKYMLDEHYISLYMMTFSFMRWIFGIVGEECIISRRFLCCTLTNLFDILLLEYTLLAS